MKKYAFFILTFLLLVSIMLGLVSLWKGLSPPKEKEEIFPLAGREKCIYIQNQQENGG